MLRLLLYCTRQKPYLYNQNVYEFYDSKYITSNLKHHKDCDYILNGKIVAECDYEVEEIYFEDNTDIAIGSFYGELLTDTLSEEDLCYLSCLTDKELHNYLNGKNGYAIHIKNLNVFDKPRELFNYETQEIWNNTSHYHRTINKAPQNMMYCYGRNTGDKYILISIRAEWLCKILNGEKTIEIRKKVLKEMITDA